MIILKNIKYHVVEKAYETVEERKNDAIEMEKQGYKVTRNYSDIYEYTRRYEKEL
jgi:hypothetical protein